MAESPPIRVSDERILELNDQIQSALLLYVAINKDHIRFDMPDKDHPPDAPTICVFLYDIQEDMKLRHSLPGLARSSAPRFVPVKCCYLLTYWDSLKESVVGPRSQTMKVMNQVLNALLNLETVLLSTAEEGEEASILTRVIEPSEQLAGLGNLWQSFGDKPRLCLNLAVTVPVKLTPATELVPAISHLKLDTQMSAIDGSSTDVLIRAFNATLIERLAPKTALERAQLGKLQVTISPDAIAGVNEFIVRVEGTVAPTLLDRLKSELSNIQSAHADLFVDIDDVKSAGDVTME